MAPPLHAMGIELQKMLSPRISSGAQRHVPLAADAGQAFKKIGAGACGAIFAQDGKPVVTKLSKTDDDVPWNDYRMHVEIAAAFTKHSVDCIKVPGCLHYVPKESSYLNAHPKLVDVAQTICNLPTRTLVTERVWPLQEATRALLIDRYRSPRNKAGARDDPANRDCLVRVYLVSTQGKRTGMFFSLKSFKLHLNQMLEIDSGVEEMAHRMAVAMAVMHWAAGTDARDVEFVLGSPATQYSNSWTLREIQRATEAGETSYAYTGPKSLRIEDSFHGKTDLWLLDFNQVGKITLDDAGVAQAVNAMTINDPYFPKPLQSSHEQTCLWNKFAESYLDMAGTILQGHVEDVLRLPGMFIDGLIKARQRQVRSLLEMAKEYYE